LIDNGLTIEQAVAVIRQVLEAARYAHRKGIVHRDLKPQNVIVDPRARRWSPISASPAPASPTSPRPAR
jgi:serine/threonine protein kinase